MDGWYNGGRKITSLFHFDVLSFLRLPACSVPVPAFARLFLLLLPALVAFLLPVDAFVVVVVAAAGGGGAAAADAAGAGAEAMTELSSDSSGMQR